MLTDQQTTENYCHFPGNLPTTVYDQYRHIAAPFKTYAIQRPLHSSAPIAYIKQFLPAAWCVPIVVTRRPRKSASEGGEQIDERPGDDEIVVRRQDGGHANHGVTNAFEQGTQSPHSHNAAGRKLRGRISKVGS